MAYRDCLLGISHLQNRGIAGEIIHNTAIGRTLDRFQGQFAVDNLLSLRMFTVSEVACWLSKMGATLW